MAAKPRPTLLPGIEAAEEDVLRPPELLGQVGRGYRRKLLPRFPYGVVYHEPAKESSKLSW